MKNVMGQRIRSGVLAAICLSALAFEIPAVHAGGLHVPLAQAAPATKPAALPSNVSVPGRMYIVEGIVIVLLFAGAVFAVCRSSGRN